MGNQFYYTNATHEVTGPCTTLQLMALQKAGTLTESSLVCADGSEEWVELKTIYPAARFAKTNQEPADPTGTAASSSGSAVSGPEADSVPRTPHPATWTQAAILIVLLALGLAMPHIGALRPVPQWEYKKVTFPAAGDDRIGAGALKFSSIQVDEHLLDMLGREGWEMTSSHLEMETAFPNLGNDGGTTGIQPNVRPQSLTVIFKRPAR